MRYKVLRPYPSAQPLRVGQIIEGQGLRNADYLVRQRYLAPVEESPTSPGSAPSGDAVPTPAVQTAEIGAAGQPPSPSSGSIEDATAAGTPRRRRRDK